VDEFLFSLSSLFSKHFNLQQLDMSGTDYKFEGWAAQGKDSTKGKLEFIDYSDEVR